jgi:hypothetical protein
MGGASPARYGAGQRGMARMDKTLTFLVIGLATGVIGGLIFWGGTTILGRPGNASTIGGCVVAMLGAVVLFLGIGIIVAGMVVP